MKRFKQGERPKSIEIQKSDEDEYRLIKVWQGGKKGAPFFITDSLDDTIERYTSLCKEYALKPDMKRVYFLINEYNKTNNANGTQTNLFESYFN